MDELSEGRLMEGFTRVGGVVKIDELDDMVGRRLGVMLELKSTGSISEDLGF